MTPFHFGQRLRIKLAAGPGLPAPTSSLTGKSTLPTTPAAQQGAGSQGALRSFRQQVDPATFSKMRRQQGQLPTPKSHTGLGSYVDVLDRWYNPWTTQKITEKGEHGLMRAGQAALGTAAVAGAAAGGIAAAPALGFGGAGAATSGTAGTTAATAAAPVAAATQTPAGQQFMNRAGQFATQAQQTLGNLSTNYFTRVEPTLNRLNYKPEDVAMDGLAAVTGNFDKIKGPGWGIKSPISMPQGAPSLPRPLEAWRNYYGADPSAPAGLARAGM